MVCLVAWCLEAVARTALFALSLEDQQGLLDAGVVGGAIAKDVDREYADPMGARQLDAAARVNEIHIRLSIYVHRQQPPPSYSLQQHHQRQVTKAAYSSRSSITM